MKRLLRMEAGALIVCLAAMSCGGDDQAVEIRTLLWNSTGEHGPAEVFIVRDFRDFEAVRERVGDRAKVLDWPSLDFRYTTVVVYVDGASDVGIRREGMTIVGAEFRDDELLLRLEPGDDHVDDDDDVQWWDFQVIGVDPSLLPVGRTVRVVAPNGETMAKAE